MLSALADDTPALRRQGLTLGATRAGFWSRPDALEHLKRLLVDPDAQVRELALSVVEGNRLLAGTEKETAKHVGPGAASQGGRRRPGPQIARAGLLAANGIDPGDRGRRRRAGPVPAA